MLTSHTYDGGEGEDRDRRAEDSFERAGLGRSGYTRLDTGHMLGAGYVEPGGEFGAGGWNMHVIHSASTDRRGDHTKVIQTYLGHDHDHVGEAATRFFRRPDVLAAMADQMQPGEWNEPHADPWERHHRWF